MKINKNLDRIINIVFAIALLTVLMIVSSDSLVLLLSIPIILAAVKVNYDFLEFTSVLVGMSLVGFMFIDVNDLNLTITTSLILAIVLLIITKTKISDKAQIALNFLISSIVFIGIYKYQMNELGLDVNKMAMDLKEIVDVNMEYRLKDEAYLMAASLYPGILSVLSLIYSLVSIKLIRNFRAYKKDGIDMIPFKMLRLTKKDLLILIGLSILSYILVPFLFWVDKDIVFANIIWILSSILILNGIMVYGYIMSFRRSKLSEIIQWIVVFVFFYFFALIFMILGIVDIFFDFRKSSRRRINAI